ncbi:hypothetical protein BX661DRAFT_184189 [Kickxella alabastrina]|uniref:uncharacterized protein n=1 Tax=Kickxella alabastrina TaxID=61397 RepID=UPI0022200779|nr:uncharacterized protein BX661DRAFT_184189 [Kickxella alabastrina]KAI7825800.1 hypothetical protein BX661DRAFT_184189 [Kickxella alabastrina]
MLFAGAQASTPRFVGFSHAALLRFCAQQKADFQMRPQLPLVASVRSYSGYGLLHCAFLGVYVGCATLVVPPPVFFAAPLVWFDLVQRHGVKDAFATLPMLQHAMSALAAAPPPRGALSLACVRNLIVATDERIDPAACAQIRDFFAPFGLDARAINPLYATQMNACISTRAYLGVPPLTLRLDPHALRRARVVAVAADAAADADGMAAGLLVLQDSGKVSGSTMVAIVDPATRMPLPAGAIGEVWVCSQSNALNRRTPLPGLSSGAVAMPMPMPAADEAATGFLATSRDCEFVRTGDLGFLYLQPADEAAGSAPPEPYLFVAGKMDATFTVDGYMYFYADIERAVEDPAEDILPDSCVVFQTTFPPLANADSSASAASSNSLRLVAVIMMRQMPTADSFLPNIACLAFSSVLDRHQVLLDEIVFVPRDALPRSRIAERRRRTVRGMYESAKLNAFVSFPILNATTTTLPSGVSNPNNRLSFMGPASLNISSSLMQQQQQHQQQHQQQR